MTGPARRVAVNALLDRLDQRRDALTIPALGEVFGSEFWNLLHEFSTSSTLRDQCAMAVLPVFLKWEGPVYRQHTTALADIAAGCYLIADALMAARRRVPPPKAAAGT